MLLNLKFKFKYIIENKNFKYNLTKNIRKSKITL